MNLEGLVKLEVYKYEKYKVLCLVQVDPHVITEYKQDSKLHYRWFDYEIFQNSFKSELHRILDQLDWSVMNPKLYTKFTLNSFIEVKIKSTKTLLHSSKYHLHYMGIKPDDIMLALRCHIRSIDLNRERSHSNISPCDINANSSSGSGPFKDTVERKSLTPKPDAPIIIDLCTSSINSPASVRDEVLTSDPISINMRKMFEDSSELSNVNKISPEPETPYKRKEIEKDMVMDRSAQSNAVQSELLKAFEDVTKQFCPEMQELSGQSNADKLELKNIERDSDKSLNKNLESEFQEQSSSSVGKLVQQKNTEKTIKSHNRKSGSELRVKEKNKQEGITKPIFKKSNFILSKRRIAAKSKSLMHKNVTKKIAKNKSKHLKPKEIQVLPKVSPRESDGEANIPKRPLTKTIRYYHHETDIKKPRIEKRRHTISVENNTFHTEPMAKCITDKNTTVTRSKIEKKQEAEEVDNSRENSSSDVEPVPSQLELDLRNQLNHFLDTMDEKPPPKVDALYLNDMSREELLGTFDLFRSKLDKTFEHLKNKQYVQSYMGLNHMNILNIISKDMQLEMLQKCSDIYSPVINSNHVVIFTNGLLPYWIMLIFMDRFGMTSEQAVQQILGQQEYADYMKSKEGNWSDFSI